MLCCQMLATLWTRNKTKQSRGIKSATTHNVFAINISKRGMHGENGDINEI